MTQNILADETGVADVIDPLGGSYFVESMTNEIEKRAWEYIEKIDELGGMLEAVKRGYIESEILKSIIEYRKAVDSGEMVVVGVNKYVVDEDEYTRPRQEKVNLNLAEHHIQRTIDLKITRNQDKAARALDRLQMMADSGEGNIFEGIIEALKADVTHGEIVARLRETFGESQPSTFI